MLSLKSLFALVLSATGSAAFFNGDLLRREIIQVRDMSTAPMMPTPTTGSDACSSVLADLVTLITELPAPTGDLSSYLVTAASTLTDPCNLSIPSSIAPAFTSYESAVESFYMAHEAQLNSALQACPTLTMLANNNFCSTHMPVTGMMASSTPTATSTLMTPMPSGPLTMVTSTGISTLSDGSVVTATFTTPMTTSTAGANAGAVNAALAVAAGFAGAVAMVL